MHVAPAGPRTNEPPNATIYGGAFKLAVAIAALAGPWAAIGHIASAALWYGFVRLLVARRQQQHVPEKRSSPFGVTRVCTAIGASLLASWRG